MKRFLGTILLVALLTTGANALTEIEQTDIISGGNYNLIWNGKKVQLETMKRLNSREFIINEDGMMILMSGQKIRDVMLNLNKKLIDKSLFYALPSKLNTVKYGNTFVDDMAEDFIELLEKVDYAKKVGVIESDKLSDILK